MHQTIGIKFYRWIKSIIWKYRFTRDVTQAEYNEIRHKNPDTIYFIKDDYRRIDPFNID